MTGSATEVFQLEDSRELVACALRKRKVSRHRIALQLDRVMSFRTLSMRGSAGTFLTVCSLSLLTFSACGGNDEGAAPSEGGAGASQGGSGTAGAAQTPAAGAAGASSAGSAGGGASGAGGSGAGGTNVGGSNAGSASGGAHAAGSGGRNSGSAGAGSAGAGSAGAGKAFAQNRFHFGTIDSIAKSAGSSMISQLDFFTSGWIQGDSFDHKGVCDDTKAGAPLANLVPVMVAYISAAHVKRQDKTVCDCNVTSSPCVAANDLCHVGAQRISQQFTTILNAYKSYSQGFAACYGTTKPIVFELEPDWYQYTTSSQSQPWSGATAGQMLGQIVAALKSSLPNALFSIDASPWVGPSNGSDNGKQWYANFDLSVFTFVNTSGGGTNANTAKIRSSNGMTWAGLSQVTGKPILADTGYGANGSAAGEDALWNDAANINARVADGVVSISQYNPKSDWGSRIAAVRAQLNTPKFKP
jgi:hypothetical protein